MNKVTNSKIELTHQQVDEIGDFLTKLPKVTLTAEQAVQKWAPAIIAKIANDGYTVEMICEILAKEKDIKISPSTLKKYLSRYKKGSLVPHPLDRVTNAVENAIKKATSGTDEASKDSNSIDNSLHTRPRD